MNIAAGDKSSALAYAAAKKTFGSRKGLIGKPVVLEGGFSGALDFGSFYLVMNSDGVGTKIEIAETMGKYDTLGYDLLAMVADDAVCVGAETVSITNTIDTEKVRPKVVAEMMKGLNKACREQKVVIPGGEIGEMPGMVKGSLWNATAIGVVGKKSFITGNGVRPGDKIIALRSRGFRANGFSLVRHILKKKLGTKWYARKFDGKKKWGEVVLTPSKIYSAALLELLGRYGKPRKCKVKALAHVTGGGIPGNLSRILGGYGAELTNLFPPHAVMRKLQELGVVSDKEAYKTWNMGTGMLVISNDVDDVKKILAKNGVAARVVGEVTSQKGIKLISKGISAGQMIKF